MCEKLMEMNISWQTMYPDINNLIKDDVVLSVIIIVSVSTLMVSIRSANENILSKLFRSF